MQTERESGEQMKMCSIHSTARGESILMGKNDYTPINRINSKLMGRAMRGVENACFLIIIVQFDIYNKFIDH